MIVLRSSRAAVATQQGTPAGFPRSARLWPSGVSTGSRMLFSVRAMGRSSDNSMDLGSTAGLGMVRRLILLRHAQSEESGAGVKDIQRTLTEAGREAAQQVALALESQGWAPDKILCSPSIRTRQTLDAMLEASDELAQAEVKFVETFYTVAALDGHTRPELEKSIIAENNFEDVQTFMCMGHNKGWEEAASSFAGVPVKLQTSNAALLQAEGETWEQAFENGFSLLSVVTPTGPKVDNLVSLDEDLQPN